MPASRDQPLSLYFHLPFCTKKCPYCHFYVLPDQESLKEELERALLLEWNREAPKFADKKVVSLYFGGGTPSLFGPKRIGALIERVNAPGAEITLEVNPEHVTVALMRAYAESGVNRVSIGVQALDDALLGQLGRGHTAQGALEAIDTTLQSGIANISIDLMIDIPTQTLKSWENTLEQLRGAPITHLSLYNLTFEKETVFFKRKKSLAPLLPSPEASVAMLQLSSAKLSAFGLERYEISAFAKKGFASRHNVGYWTARPFWGFGPSAFSYWEGARKRNVAHLKHYAALLASGKSPIDFEEKLAYPDNLHELLAVELRLLLGVDLAAFEQRHGSLPKATHQLLDKLTEEGLLIQSGPRIQLSERGLLFYDSVAAAII